MRRWQTAMTEALYGPGGFFVRPGTGPASHFRTSAHASPLFAGALAALLQRLDLALGHPDPLDLVDIGAGRGELLAALCAAAPAPLARRLRPVAVELAPPPEPGRDRDQPAGVAIRWLATPPAEITGLVLATEWLDNIPVEVVQADSDGVARYLLVDPATGTEAAGEPVTGPDADWLARWWPLRVPGSRAEVGRSRDEAWSAVCARVVRGAALAIDYGHTLPERPPLGTLTGYRAGREVPPVPDGSCDLTAHVAIDAVAAAATMPAPPRLCRQRAALNRLGIDGRRPPLTAAREDPAGYLRRLAVASEAAELTEPAGLGGHFWLLQPAGIDPATLGLYQ